MNLNLVRGNPEQVRHHSCRKISENPEEIIASISTPS